MNIRLPHITGPTDRERIAQIVSYLRELALDLDREQTPEAVSSVQPEQAKVEIIGRGEKDGWHWRKFSDGTAECWKRSFQTIAVTSAWGNLFYGYSQIQAFPFAFASPPSCSATVEQKNKDNVSVWLCSYSPTTSAQTAQYVVVSADSVAEANVYITYHAIGRWK